MKFHAIKRLVPSLAMLVGLTNPALAVDYDVTVKSRTDAAAGFNQNVYVGTDGKETVVDDKNRLNVELGVAQAILKYVADSTKNGRNAELDNFLKNPGNLYVISQGEKGFSLCQDEQAKRCVVDPVDKDTIFAPTVAGANATKKVKPQDGVATYVLTALPQEVTASVNTPLEDVVRLATGVNQTAPDSPTAPAPVVVEKTTYVGIPSGSLELSARAGLTAFPVNGGYRLPYAAPMGGLEVFYHPTGRDVSFGLGLDVYQAHSVRNEALASKLALEGPLANRLELRGAKQTETTIPGANGSIIVRNPRLIVDTKYFGLGLQGSLGLTYQDNTVSETTSAQKFLDGKVIEGSETSQQSGNSSSQWGLTPSIGVPVQVGPVCMTPSIGYTFGSGNLQAGLSLGYCRSK